MIVYATYLQCEGLECQEPKDMGLWRSQIIKVDGYMILLNDWCHQSWWKRIAGLSHLGTNGESSIIGNYIEVVSWMRNDIPNSIGVHYIAHCEALVIAYVSTNFLRLFKKHCSWKWITAVGCS